MAAQSSDHGLVTSPVPACSPRQRVLCTSCADDLKQKEKSGPPSDLTRTGNSISTYNILDRAVCYYCRSTWYCSSCYYCCYYFCVILLIYSCNLSFIYTSDTPDLAVTIALHGCCCS